MAYATEGELAERLGRACFLCLKPIAKPNDRFTFSPVNRGTPELPCHSACLEVRGPQAVARLYHARVADLVDVSRRAVGFE